jgi:hypothetical protein
VSQGGIPQAVFKSKHKLTKDQAEAIQASVDDSDDSPERCAAGAAARP